MARRSTNPVYFIAFVLAAAALCIGLPLAADGCSTVSSLTSPGATSSPSAVAADPVPLLKETGATPVPGTVTGSTDPYGDRYASGSFPGGESVTVYTSATQAGFTAEQARVPQPDDLHGLLTIPDDLAVITMTGVVNVTTGGNQWGGPTPSQVAASVAAALKNGDPVVTW